MNESILWIILIIGLIAGAYNIGFNKGKKFVNQNKEEVKE